MSNIKLKNIKILNDNMVEVTYIKEFEKELNINNLENDINILKNHINNLEKYIFDFNSIVNYFINSY